MAVKPYFSHDMEARLDPKIATMLCELGYEGYGVFWGIVEWMTSEKNCSLPFDPEVVAHTLNANYDTVSRVITDYDLFVLTENGNDFFSRSARRRKKLRTPSWTPTDEPKRGRGRPPKEGRDDRIRNAPFRNKSRRNPERITAEIQTTQNSDSSFSVSLIPTACGVSFCVDPDYSFYQNEYSSGSENDNSSAQAPAPVPAPAPAIEKPKQEMEEEPKEEPRPEPKPQKVAAKIVTEKKEQPMKDQPMPNEDEFILDADGAELPQSPDEKIIEIWNRIFNDKKSQRHRGFTLSAKGNYNAKQSLESGYTLEDMEIAFRIAKEQDFPWLLADVLKPENIQRLLVQAEKNQEKVVKAELQETQVKELERYDNAEQIPGAFRPFMGVQREEKTMGSSVNAGTDGTDGTCKNDENENEPKEERKERDAFAICLEQARKARENGNERQLYFMQRVFRELGILRRERPDTGEPFGIEELEQAKRNARRGIAEEERAADELQKQRNLEEFRRNFGHWLKREEEPEPTSAESAGTEPAEESGPNGNAEAAEAGEAGEKINAEIG